MSRRAVGLAAAAAAALLVLLFGTRDARATEIILWESLQQNSIGAINTNGTGGSLVNTGGAVIDAPQGLSYDPVTNRLYVASEGVSADGNISFVRLDGGSGGPPAGPMPLPPLLPAVKDPRGVVVDPVARIAYWLNNTDSASESILWSRLDGSEGGELNLGGQTLLGTERLTIDPAAGRLYWGNDDGSFHYVPLVGSGGTAGELEAKANGAGANNLGLAIDDATGRIFWVEFGINAVWTAGLTGPAKSESVSGALDQPTGVAYDPVLNRLYWANWGVEFAQKGALGFASPGAPAEELNTNGIATDLPQDPLVIKSPTSTAAPQLALVNGRLQCTQGGWGPDYVSSFVYQSPRSFSYSWTLNGNPIAGATESSLAPSSSGSYACFVTAANQAGSTSRASAGLAVTVTTNTRPGKTVTRQGQPKKQTQPADLQLLGKARHLRAPPGKLLTLKVRTTNEGTVASNPANLCLKLTKGAKRALRAGKCQRLGALRGGATDVAKLRLRVKGSAQPGLYKLRIAVPGSQTKVTVRVLG